MVEDIGTPALTWRRLGLFIDRLCTRTPDSYLAQSQVTPEERLWDIHAQLMALFCDRLAVSNWLQAQALVGRGIFKKSPIDSPTPIPRPGVQPEAEDTPKKGKGMKAIIRTIDPAGAAKAGI